MSPETSPHCRLSKIPDLGICAKAYALGEEVGELTVVLSSFGDQKEAPLGAAREAHQGLSDCEVVRTFAFGPPKGFCGSGRKKALSFVAQEDRKL